VGRQRELARLEQAVDEAASGLGSVALLVGEAGIGKTRTALELASRAEQRNALVLRGRCYEGEETPPYGPWKTALRPVVLSRLVPEAADIVAAGAVIPLPAADARFRFFDAVIELLRTAARDRPAVVLLDNLQWADPDSLKLLQHAAAETADVGVLLLGTCRESDVASVHPLTATLAELAKESRFRRVRLSGLSRDEVGQYLARATESQPEAGLVEEIHRRTDGNPLFVVELAREMAETPQELWPALRVPEGIKQAIGARLSHLPGECVAVLTTASLIGRVFEIEALTEIVQGSSRQQVVEALERARIAGIVDETGEGRPSYRFAHVLVQEALSDALPAPARAQYHARIAEALARLSGSDAAAAAAIVQHLEAAGDPESLRKLVPFALAAAGHALESLAPDQAVALLDRALKVKEKVAGTRPDAETAELLYRRGRALDEMASPQAAAQSLARAFELYSALGNVARMVEVALTPAQYAIPIGHGVTWSYHDTGLVELRDRALQVVQAGSIEHGRLLLQSRLSRPDIEQALVIARRQKDRALEMKALRELSYFLTSAGELAAAKAEEEKALAIAKETGDRYAVRILLYWRCRRCLLEGDLRGMQAGARELLAEAERLRSRLALASARQTCGQAACLAGDWDGCREHARRCLELLRVGRGEAHSHRVALQLLTMADAETGHVERAEEHLRDLGALSGDPLAPEPFLMAKLARVTGETSRLDAVVAALEKPLGSDLPFAWLGMSRRFALALIAVIRGDRTEAARYLDHYRPWKGLHISNNMNGMASDALIALLLVTLGRADDAMGHFEDALAFCTRCGFRPELARTCHDYARALLGRGHPADRERARVVLGQGLVIARELRMVPAIRRIEETLARAVLGEAHPARLSSREVEVLKLAAAGKANKEIAANLHLSYHTVVNHIKSIYAKTGVHSRAELANYATRTGLAAP